ncbi:hypothetical protein SHI21_05335 [Bacteriovorax sp. PP10]|uniref:SGNH/GDSL hydrolase family protein n=1 Tax=Bacteriovorax antarcticus TaxID=3088717 RepID=A0ABU5VRE3_9BACT|nr:hypothetical protein [Bacteriovorax sp. PP10]MEA9355609.1 hypothetical protein [Bacteriovorax sp. PP10]
MNNIGKTISCLGLGLSLLGAAYGIDDLTKANEFEENQTTEITGHFKEQYYVWYGPGHSNEADIDLKNKVGWVYAVDSRVLQIKTPANGINGYKAFYNIDKVGMRILPKLPKKPHHLIVAGESNVFGVGVRDEETLPYLLSQRHPNYHAYNFGHPGGGPHNTLARFEKTDWYSQIEENDGRMIYIFSPAWMLERVAVTKNYLSWEKGNSPWYELENGKLVYKGILKDRLQTKILNFIRLIDYFGWVGDLPKFNSDHIKLTAKLIEETKRQYLKVFPKGKFTAVVSNYMFWDPALSNELISLLKLAQVDVVLINKDPKSDPKFHFADFHFNYEGQKMIESEISKVIKF